MNPDTAANLESSRTEDASHTDGADMGTAALPGRVLDIAVVRSLSHRSDLRGLSRFGIHLMLMAATGTLVYLAGSHWALRIPAMLLHGFTIVTMFAPMHECVHRTAFASRRLNEVCGWIAGLLSFYNFTYYRYYHTWHHRFTQNPEKDPELKDPKPSTVISYIVEISGIRFWLGRPWMFLSMALGRFQNAPFVPENARRRVAVSSAVQLAIYVAGIASIAWGAPYAWYYWFLPAILAQPLLRAMLIVEHTGCSHDEDGLTNTRTTLARFPARFLMWNMPFHTEHHLYPSIPFHELPRAHHELRDRLAHLEPNYLAANRAVIDSFATKSNEGAV